MKHGPLHELSLEEQHAGSLDSGVPRRGQKIAILFARASEAHPQRQPRSMETSTWELPRIMGPKINPISYDPYFRKPPHGSRQ